MISEHKSNHVPRVKSGEKGDEGYIGKPFLFDFNGHENTQAQCGHTSCKQTHLQPGIDVNNKGSNQT